MESLNLSPGVYLAIGTLVVFNIANIISVMVFIFKAGSFVAETKAGIKDAKDAAVRAHKRIDSEVGVSAGE